MQAKEKTKQTPKCRQIREAEAVIEKRQPPAGIVRGVENEQRAAVTDLPRPAKVCLSCRAFLHAVFVKQLPFYRQHCTLEKLKWPKIHNMLASCVWK